MRVALVRRLPSESGGGAPSVGEEAEVADADEALGEQVKKEATEKLIARDSHHFLLIVVGRVPANER